MSIDIGIHNLAINIMEADNVKDFKTYKIHLLEVYDIFEDTDHHCKSFQKNKKICNKKCGFKYLCNVDPETISTVTTEITETTINKQEKVWKYTCKLHAPKETKLIEYKRKTIDKYPLQEIVTLMINKINDIYKEHLELFDKLSKIHIELQPSKNPKAKLISHIIYGKLIDIYTTKNFEPPEIKFIPAKQKLKIHYTGPELICKLKSEYSQRKWMSVEICKWYLQTQFNHEQKEKWLPILLDGKSDDKGDTSLMSINCLYGIPKAPKKPKTPKKQKKTKNNLFKK